MDELDKLTKIENNQTLQIENLLKYISTLDFILYALIFLIILYFLIYIVRNIKLKFSKNYLILRNQITKMDKTSKILVIGILTILISLSLGYIFGEKLKIELENKGFNVTFSSCGSIHLNWKHK